MDPDERQRLRQSREAIFLEDLALVFAGYPNVSFVYSMDGVHVKFDGDSRRTVFLGFTSSQIIENARAAAEERRKAAE